ncbi:AEL133Cp [Eremothecium gossypii ATCC 10895]|uniref:AEL133Cp n=1 Tax=Eremothecium gossypii (strain ATCC 10895 / CBS 109.51 / FGSC 9923 / NRRL Y-1056) TaxID=284811 RepID=Q757Z3_EREGS|nr:AEL133Cp [Eremothecium gossypii ATCC 10895]AAS52552.1 AEL133Cp [Eremothecium gossypii ATCC 10895]AEY96852.1 FAEL133Cp [Eremothecium gossypii FDAG1]
MSHQTPRLDPAQIASTNHSVFRLIAKVVAQPKQEEITIQSPTTNREMVTLGSVRVSQLTKFKVEQWYEFVCRASDSGDAGVFVLDSVELPLPSGEELSVDGVVALQQLCSKFPEMY